MFGEFGGSYVPPQLQEVLDRLAEAFERYKEDPEFIDEFKTYLREYVGRESPLTYAKHLSEAQRGQDLSKKGGSEPYRIA